MNKFLKMFSISITLIALISTNVFASTSPVVSFYENEQRLLMNFNAGTDNAFQPFSVIVKDKSENAQTVDDLLYFYQDITDRDGNAVLNAYTPEIGDYSDKEVLVNVSTQNYVIPLEEGKQIVFDKFDNEYYKFDVDAGEIKVNGICVEFDKSIERIKVYVIHNKTICESKTINVDSDKKFSFSFIFDMDKNESGDYVFKFTDADNEIISNEFEFSYVNPTSKINELSLVLKSSLTTEEKSNNVISFFSDSRNREILGLKTFVIDKYDSVEKLDKSIIDRFVQGYDSVTTIEDLKKKLINSFLLDYFFKNHTDVSAMNKMIFEDYSQEYDLSDSDIIYLYQELDSSEQLDIFSKIYEENIQSLENFKKVFIDSLLITKINSFSVWSEIANFIKKHESYFSLKHISYMSNSDYDKLLKNKIFEDIKQFEDKFNEISQQAYERTNGAGGSTGGTGGSSSRPSASFGVSDIVTPNQNKIAFSDLDDCEWAKDSILSLYEAGIVCGKTDNKFYPNDFITREELIKIIVGALGTDVGLLKNESSYSDVNLNEWYTPYVYAAKQLGITLGKDDGSFGVGELITRQDAATFIYRYYKKTNAFLNKGESKNFTDYSDISDYCKDAVSELSSLGIVNGTDSGAFLPHNNCTRAEVCKMIHRIYFGKNQ